MSKETEGISLVKLTKEEHKKQKEDVKQAKKDAIERIPVSELEKQKKYKKVIYITLALLGTAIIVLGLMITNVLPALVGVLLLVIISVTSTYISRKSQKS